MPFDASPSNPFLSEANACLKSVFDGIGSLEHLSTTRRRDMLSSLRRISAWLETPLEKLPADINQLRERLGKLHHALANVQKKTCQNHLSNVHKAIQAVLGSDPGSTKSIPLSAPWQHLFDSSEPRIRWSLSRLARYCSALDIEPGGVCDAVIRNFQRALVDEGCLKDPEETTRNTIRTWNQAAESCPEWPATALTPPPAKKPRWTIDLSEFAQSFQTDIALWEQRVSGNDPFSLDGPPRPLRPATVKHQKFLIQQCASALVLSEVPQNQITSLSVLVEPDNFRTAMQHLYVRAGETLTEANYNIARLMKSIARHHVKVADEDLQEISRLVQALRYKPKGLRPRNRAKLRQLDDPENLRRLYQCPIVLFEQAIRTGKHDRRSAYLMSMAVAIEILIKAPVRVENLAGIRFGQNLTWTRPGREGTLHLVFDAHETKNSEPSEHELNGASARMIQFHIEKYRDLLTTGPSDYLFPGRNGGRRSAQSLSGQIKKELARQTGLNINAHLFRHIAAKTILDRSPGAHTTVQRILGGRSMDVILSNYSGMEVNAARRAFGELVETLRKQPSSKHLRRRKKR